MGDAGKPSRTGTEAGGKRPARCIALVGPFQTGKTTLLEAVLARMGAVPRQGSVSAGTSVGDGSEEARAHAMSTELNTATVTFLGDAYTFLDCPGSIEYLAEMRAVLPVVDAAVLVCDADEKKGAALQIILRELEALALPRLLFLNKIETAPERIADTVALLQPASAVPLLLRQLPLHRDGKAVGYVDLALERAFLYQEQAPSRAVDIPAEAVADEKQARYSLLEHLADHDDRLMEELLDDVAPEPERVFGDLAYELQDGVAVPVLLGSALHGNGVLRLMKALRHEVPDVTTTARRLGVPDAADTLAQVLKTIHTTHTGKLSLARILRGTLRDGTTVITAAGESARIAGVSRLTGQTAQKVAEAAAGDTVALGRLDTVRTGDTLAVGRPVPALVTLAPAPAAMTIAVKARDRKDDVKLGAAIRKLIEEDGAIEIEHHPEQGEIILRGQGEMHLRVSVERLASKFGVTVAKGPAQIGHRETIRKGVQGVRGRHKKQSGGHGQFGDIVIDVAPLPRGQGFEFHNRITGGVVPKQYVPSVEEGVRAALKHGPLGFPVVDVSVSLTDGSYHTVDSSDMAFQQAARLAMAEALPKCAPVLLEPVLAVDIIVPSEATAKANGIVAARRGQILGFDARDGWPGWDVVRATIPEAEMTNLITELRSISSGVGTFRASFDHLAELDGRQADQVVAGRGGAGRGRGSRRPGSGRVSIRPQRRPGSLAQDGVKMFVSGKCEL